MEKFYSKSSKKHISDKDYARAQKVWTTFGCKTFEDNLQVCLKSDIMQLTEGLQNFLRLCLSSYNVDFIHYCTLASYPRDA